jgi:hypothetical protein
MNDQTNPPERQNPSGLPYVKSENIWLPSDTLWQKDVADAAAVANDFMLDTYADETLPPQILVRDQELIVPLYGVVVDTFIRAMVAFKKIKAPAAIAIIKALEGKTDCDVWEVAIESSNEASKR